MRTIDTVAGPTPQDLHGRATTEETATASDKSIGDVGHVRLVTGRAADPRPALTLQRQLIAGLVG